MVVGGGLLFVCSVSTALADITCLNKYLYSYLSECLAGLSDCQRRTALVVASKQLQLCF